ncbi:PhzF family phenazine biosynthesis protein [Pseudohalocynthiibacter aestuariivivens]|jgi:PhzF family phenazine biosynthesis protein|uniref:PhzF family phenazine biosynthesis protein n=1 Tax=Pseudohalocynthiibacter aestuariivivens TaxID=1591409 RepID=A0ABV5JCY2_9RHOB|nr:MULTISPECIES: PhzF family phenazine biosynthesis protein [Pseudohalocynthiibacter]MBS9717188.1 PhzF family phenazine biosynthesis protein [Pseudohalocynthiibacter aestuariivivens]MCK0103708.1 PhzF family phenazine biosynthesis protein [Pseudohalocynthiibacter sp. F2068]
MRYQFDWVDAFTSQPFGGNGCVVVHGADALEIADRLALVRETSLSECAYLVASDVADFGARYYLADKEILMAGHPTVATVASLLDRGMVTLTNGRAEFSLEVGAGVLPIEVEDRPEGPLITMTQMAPKFGATHDPGKIAKLMSLRETDVLGSPQTVSTGTPFCVTLLKDKDALRRATLMPEAWQEMNPPGTPRADLIEPFLVTMGGETEAGDTFSRLLLPKPMPPEDPFTGSATGCMAAYLWHHGIIEKPRFTAEQGHWMGRPGQAEVDVMGPRDAIAGVKVSGQGRVVMRGELLI